MTYGDWYVDVGRFAASLRRAGIRVGDRVAGYMPNLPETIVAALGAAAVGAVWSSCSPDFGVQGVLDRFGQIEPRILIAAAEYQYGGKTFDQREKVAAVLAQLPTIDRAVVGPDAWDGFLQPHRGAPLTCTPLPF